MAISRFFRGAASLCLFAFAAVLVLIPVGYAVTALVACVLALAAGVWLLLGGHRRRSGDESTLPGNVHSRTSGNGQRRLPADERHNWSLDSEDVLWLGAVVLYALVWLADVARSAEWPVGELGRGVLLPLWPLLAALVVLVWRALPPSFTAWRFGVGLGAVAACGMALYERIALGHARAGYFINSIPFGDLALLLGVLSAIALVDTLEDHRRHSLWRWWLGAAALAGLVASLLSGTRGGWIALPVLVWLWYGNFYRVVSRGTMITVSLVLALSLSVAVAVPHTGVAKRVDQAVDQVRGYFLAGEKATSVGIRLEMWRAGAHLIVEKPLFGWGEGGLQQRRNELVDQGLIHRGVERYDQLHSDLIDTTARRGLIGLLSLLLLYGVPLVLFARRLSPDRSSEVRTLALSGVAVVAAFIDFGLTQTLLRDVHGLAAFLGLSAACWVLMRRAEYR